MRLYVRVFLTVLFDLFTVVLLVEAAKNATILVPKGPDYLLLRVDRQNIPED